MRAFFAAAAASVGGMTLFDPDSVYRRWVLDSALFPPPPPPANDKLELVQAHVLFRHGARAPFEDCEDQPDIWKPKLRADLRGHPPVRLRDLNDFGEVLYEERMAKDGDPLGGGLQGGVLTHAGLAQARDLGTLLKRRYIDTGLLSANNLVLRSSLRTRTIETLRGVLKGMLPDHSAHTFDVLVGKKGKGNTHTDWLDFNIDCCPRLKDLYMHSVHEWSEDRMPEDIRPILAKVREDTALTVTGNAKKYGLIAWRDWTSCRTGSGQEQLPGVTQEKFEALEELSSKQITAWFSGAGRSLLRTELLRLAHGNTLSEVVARMSSDQGDKKLFLYSAHDWTLLPVVMMLRPNDTAPYPQYCSELTFELFREKGGEGRHFVRVIFGKGTSGPGFARDEPGAVRVEGCEGQEMCELSRFRQCVDRYRPNDYSKECGCKD